MSTQPEGFGSSVPVHPLVEARWSPRDLDPGVEVTDPQLRALLEAARWAPSWGGTAPARFVAARRGTPDFDALAATLTRGNAWAKRAGALVLGLALSSNDKGELPYAAFDLGAAVAHLQLQAVAEGLVSHAMAGFDAQGAARAVGAPADATPLVVVAVGHRAAPDTSDPDLADRDARPRRRPDLDDLAFGGRWGTPLP